VIGDRVIGDRDRPMSDRQIADSSIAPASVGALSPSPVIVSCGVMAGLARASHGSGRDTDILR